MADPVPIRPSVKILGMLEHLRYQPWYALAEYVDNSIQSFFASRDMLPRQSHVTVNIEIDRSADSIIITDNAGGIAVDDFPRAFRPAEAPPNATGLSEFGMGMKSASCWFSPLWEVRTSAIGDPVERLVKFDMQQILATNCERLNVQESEVLSDSHFTEITLRAVRQMPQGRTLGKIRDHLSDIYRCFLRDGILKLNVGGEELQHYQPQPLVAPRFNSQNEPEGEPKTWQKEISFALPDGRVVTGIAGVLSQGDTRRAGLSLFRRNRAIVGSGDDKYRPAEIFGSGNSYESQRVWGEIHMDNFPVSHTKDGFQWRGAEEAFLDALKRDMDADDLPLLRQARNFRSKHPSKATARTFDLATSNVSAALAQNVSTDFASISQSAGDASAEPMPSNLADTPSESLVSRSFVVDHSGESWTVGIELSTGEESPHWLVIASNHDDVQRTRHLQLRVHTLSPFMRRIVKLDELDSLEPVLRIAAALGLAEVLSRMSGMDRHAGEVRRIVNTLLGSSLSSKTD